MEEIFAKFGAFIQSIMDWYKNIILSIIEAFSPSEKEA